MRATALARLPALLAATLLAAPAAQRPPQAQQWRTLDVSRQLLDSSALRVTVRYGVGRLGLGAASSPVLYDMRLRYDARRAAPLHAFTPATRRVELGLRPLDGEGLRREPEAGELRVALARAVPLDLSLELGAVQADLDLTGLRVGRLAVSSGASDATIHFDAPNPERMSALELNVGAASVRALRLANARAPEVVVSAGVGSMDLDFGGRWTEDVDLRVRVALGGVTVRVPREVGVRVELEKFLATFEHEGLVRRGDAWVTENWDRARHKLTVRTQTTFGSFRLDRTGQ